MSYKPKTYKKFIATAVTDTLVAKGISPIESNVERLNHIKDFTYPQLKDISWLIKQAERAEELEERLREYQSDWSHLSPLVKKNLDENARLIEVIKVAMKNTHDDDTHEFLNRALKAEENDAPSYRLRMERESK